MQMRKRRKTRVVKAEGLLLIRQRKTGRRSMRQTRARMISRNSMRRALLSAPTMHPPRRYP